MVIEPKSRHRRSRQKENTSREENRQAIVKLINTPSDVMSGSDQYKLYKLWWDSMSEAERLNVFISLLMDADVVHVVCNFMKKMYKKMDIAVHNVNKKPISKEEVEFWEKIERRMLGEGGGNSEDKKFKSNKDIRS